MASTKRHTSKSIYCEGNAAFDPAEQLQSQEALTTAEQALAQHDLALAIRSWFKLPKDKYVYHASGSVTLDQAQHAVAAGGVNNLHAWYRDAEGNPVASVPFSSFTS